jgi:hypothetical protein
MKLIEFKSLRVKELRTKFKKCQVSSVKYQNHTSFIIVLFFALFAFSFQSSNCYASFLDIGMGPRALGMGNAFTGLANDGYASYYNPAGLAQIQGQEISMSYASLYGGLDYLSDLGDGFLGYAYPLDPVIGTVGFSWGNRHASDRYSENSYVISYARILSELNEKLLIGVNVKILQLTYSTSTWGIDSNGNWIEKLTDPIFANGTSAIGTSFDIGTLFYLNDQLSFGFTVKDLNQPDIKLKDPNPIPLTAKLGVGYCVNEEINVLSDFTYSDNDFRFNGGIEWWFKDYPFALRGGFGVGTRNYLNLATGASYVFSSDNLPKIQIDYAFIYPFGGLEETIGSHRLGISIMFK